MYLPDQIEVEIDENVNSKYDMSIATTYGNVSSKIKS